MNNKKSKRFQNQGAMDKFKFVSKTMKIPFENVLKI